MTPIAPTLQAFFTASPQRRKIVLGIAGPSA